MRVLIKLVFSISFCILSIRSSKASPQAPDYLIVGKDTLSIYFLPLNHLDSLTKKEFFKNLSHDGSDLRVSFNLWRGYQAYWQLIDQQLYLVSLKGYANGNEILKKTFPNHYENGKVLAYWFSSYLAVAKDKMLKWDGIFSRTYFKEEIFDFKNGRLETRRIVDNYIPVKKGISRLDSNRKHITDTLFKLVKEFNWKKLSDCDCDDKYLISINAKGKISNVELIPYTNNKDTAQIEIEDHKKCIKKFKRKFKELQFDIVRWHGEPYEEKYYFELFYTVEGELEDWTR